MNFQFDFSFTNGKSSHLYSPISLPSLLKRRTTKVNRQIILLWGLSMLVSIVVGLISLQYNWTGIPIYIGGTLAYITLYPPLIVCTFLTLWFGLWWGFVPAILSTLMLAVFSGMSLPWAVVFAFTNSLGLAVITLFFRSIPISIELRSPFAILFYIFVAFIASLVSSVGAIIWTYSNGLNIASIFAVWQGWWLGTFLQTVFINGPIFMLAGKPVVRWKSRSEDLRLWKVPSTKIIAMVFSIILVILIAFFWGTHLLSEIKLHNVILKTNDGVLLAAVTSTFEDMALMHWVNLSLVVFTAFFGYQVAINWTDTLRKSVTQQTKALRDSERHYRILFENNPLPFWVYDMETLEFLAVNDAAIQHYGYSRSEFLVMNIKDIRPVEDVPDLLRNTIHQRSGIENAGIWRHRKKDGTIIDVEVRSHELTFQGRRAKLVLVNDITERKQSEQALRESETKFRAVAETAASAIFIYQGTKFSYINPSFAAITGYSFEEIRSVNFWDIVHPDYRDVVRERGIARQRGDNVPSRYEFPIITKFGETRWIDFSAGVVEFEGKPAALGTAFDITERKRTEELHHKRNEEVIRFQTALLELGKKNHSDLNATLRDITETNAKILHIARVSIWLYNEDRTKITCEEMYRLYENDFERGMIMETQYYPKYFSALEENRILAATDARNDSRTSEFTEPYLIPYGITSMLDVPIRVQGKVIGILCHEHRGEKRAWTVEEEDFAASIADMISLVLEEQEHKRAETALRESEEKYRTLFEESKDVVFFSSADGKLLDINPAGLELFGYGKETEIFSINLADDIYWNQSERDVFLRSLNLEGFVKDFELALKRKDGSRIDVLVTATAVQDADEKILAYRGFVRDVTKQKQLEQQLFQVQKMESIGTLAGGIAHDFNNILSIILGYSSVLEKSVASPEKFSESVNAIDKAVTRGAGLVRQLLTFARKNDVQLESVNINDVIRELEKMMTETFPKTITIDVQLDNVLPSIYADFTQLHQTLLNLCVNARDAMLNGGTLTLLTEKISSGHLTKQFTDAREDEYIHLQITDTGEGMDEKIRSRIFEPFFTTKERGKGTGLGLAVVYGVIKSHRGFIDVQSIPGKGTTFHLYFPVPINIAQSLPVQIMEKEETRGGTETILLVEDEDLLRNLLRSILEQKGYRVLIAEDGEEAVSLYREHINEITLIVSDLGLPKLGGWEAYEQMQKMNPKVQAIFASGYLDPTMKEKMLAGGAKDFIHKPYDPMEILKRIRFVLEGVS